MREIFIERRDRILRIAVKEKGHLYECFIEEEEERNEPLCGEIYKGRIKNIVPAISAAFVDIGHKKDAQMNMKKGRTYKQGDEVIVEVLTEQIGNKGAKVTEDYSVAGRYAVLTANREGLSVSRRIKDENIINNLKNELVLPNDVAVTIRTSAEDTDVIHVNKEIDAIYEKICDINEKSKYILKPQRVYGENSLLHKVLIDNINNQTSKIVVDSKDDYELIKKYIGAEDETEVILHEDYRTMFDYYGIEKEIVSLRHNTVNLKNGGQIVIDKTEALYAIDVNSSKNTSHGNKFDTAKNTNMEAAYEIGKQVRLRNLSGMIIVDFIKMRDDKDKKDVLNALRKAFYNDKTNTRIYPFTELDLVQISRRKKGKSIYSYIEEKCEACDGHGKRLKLSYIENLIRNEILRVEGENAINDFYIELSEHYEKSVKGDIFTFLKEIEGITKNIYLNFVPGIDSFKVEPLLFKKQMENLEKYRVNNIEIC